MELIQQSREPAAIPEDAGLVPSTHVVLPTLYNSSFNGSDTSSDLHRFLHTCGIICTYIQAHICTHEIK